MTSPILEILDLTMRFGGLYALRDINVFLEKEKIYGLIGPNGAGKTTLINCITGVYRPEKGTIKFLGKKITGLKPHKIWKSGIARTFQIPRPFLNMTVLENMMICGQDTLDILEDIGLDRKRNLLAKKLTFIDRRMLEIARALSSKPKLLLLDEPAAGLNPTEILDLMQLVRKIRATHHCTILWIEHVMKAIMETAEKVFVLNEGYKIAEGPPKEIADDKKVIDVYLGEKYVFKGEA